ncbi:MAG: DUF1648 domain-containing protein [Flavobacteriaceae bacterium]|nr:DUF1648 domain-containing protein [Flavobacteriaceae bacterium]
MSRPKIKVPYEQIDILVELLNITLLILIWGYTIMNYLELPDTIPIHFNAKGEPDDFGHRSNLWLLPAIATFIFFLMFIVNLFPHAHNYMVNVTEENALKLYRLSTRVLRFANLFCMLLFAVLVYEIIGMSSGKDARIMSSGFLIFSIIAPLAIVIYAVIKQKQMR